MAKTARVIRRYLTEDQWKSRKDLKFLADFARRSNGELDFFLRQNRISLYHKGNHVCTVSFRPHRDRYQVSFTNRFLEIAELVEERRGKSCIKGCLATEKPSGTYLKGLDSGELRRVLDIELIETIMAAIRYHDYGGEISFEQLLMTQNPPTPEFMVLDRQVSDSGLKRKRMDVLAIRRVGKIGNKYRFCIIEIKLGHNRDLDGKVLDQLDAYVKHIQGNKQVAQDYKECYEYQYKQLKWFKVIKGHGLPDAINIKTDRIHKMVVVGYGGPDTARAIRVLKQLASDTEFRQIEFGLC